jgi:hypothetical protein
MIESQAQFELIQTQKYPLSQLCTEDRIWSSYTLPNNVGGRPEWRCTVN